MLHLIDRRTNQYGHKTTSLTRTCNVFRVYQQMLFHGILLHFEASVPVVANNNSDSTTIAIYITPTTSKLMTHTHTHTCTHTHTHTCTHTHTHTHAHTHAHTCTHHTHTHARTHTRTHTCTHTHTHTHARTHTHTHIYFHYLSWNFWLLSNHIPSSVLTPPLTFICFSLTSGDTTRTTTNCRKTSHHIWRGYIYGNDTIHYMGSITT